MPSAILVDSPALPVYDLGEGHPFAADRLRPLFALLRAHGLVAATELVRTPSADDDELRTVHERAYVEVLQRLEGGDDWDAIEAAPRFGLGSSDNPIVPGLHFAGEILDVTGRLGGFNFLWAWVTGRVAGLGAASGLAAGPPRGH